MSQLFLAHFFSIIFKFSEGRVGLRNCLIGFSLFKSVSFHFCVRSEYLFSCDYENKGLMDRILKRLTIIKELIELEEFTQIENHKKKMSSNSVTAQIIIELDAKNYGNALSLIKTALLESSQKERELILLHSQYPEYILKLLFEHYPFQIDQLDKLKGVLDWSILSRNTNIEWTPKLVERFADFWDWDDLCNNPFVVWDFDLLKEHARKVDWVGILCNDEVVWDIKRYFEFEEIFMDKDNVNYSDEEDFSYEEAILIQLLFKNTIEWDLEYFMKKFESIRNSYGPFVDTYIDFKDEVISNKVFGDTTFYYEYIKRLHEIFARKWEGIIYENEVVLVELLMLSSRNPIESWWQERSRKIEWEFLSSCHFLPWSLNLIDSFKGNFDWAKLSTNLSIPWNEELISHFESEISNYEVIDSWGDHVCRGVWHMLSTNSNVKWTEALLEKYRVKWDWNNLSKNPSVLWTEELVIKYEKYLMYYNEYRKNHYLGSFTKNQNFNWTNSFIKRYAENLYWRDLSSMERFKYSDSFIKRFSDLLDFKQLSRQKNVEWSLSLIRDYIERWDWEALSGNVSLPWSEELIKEFEDKWNWENLSSNQMLPWSTEFIRKYSDKWRWDGFNGLSNNQSIKWNFEKIKEFATNLNWMEFKRNCIPWSANLIHEFKHFIGDLPDNGNFMWENYVKNLVDDNLIDNKILTFIKGVEAK